MKEIPSIPVLIKYFLHLLADEIMRTSLLDEKLRSIKPNLHQSTQLEI